MKKINTKNLIKTSLVILMILAIAATIFFRVRSSNQEKVINQAATEFENYCNKMSNYNPDARIVCECAREKLKESDISYEEAKSVVSNPAMFGMFDFYAIKIVECIDKLNILK